MRSALIENGVPSCGWRTARDPATTVARQHSYALSESGLRKNQGRHGPWSWRCRSLAMRLAKVSGRL
jgi:hypothetical protein